MSTRTVAYFITSHGFGHSTRALAVMQAMLKKDSSLMFEVFTSTPRWLFEEALSDKISYNECLTDIGLIQKTALEEDLEETVKQINAFYPVEKSMVSPYVSLLQEKSCELVICDIAPIGIIVAQGLGVSSVLIENFTWDWIYSFYQDKFPGMGDSVDYLSSLFASATYHIQATPVTVFQKADLVTNPVSRERMFSRVDVRMKLGVSNEKKLVLITMGGGHSLGEYELDRMTEFDDCVFLIPSNGKELTKNGNLYRIPFSYEIGHTDLINTSDAVVGKIGYSTLSEVYHAGVPFGFIPRAQFPESPILEKFIKENMPSLLITESCFNNGDWLNSLPLLLEINRINRDEENGSIQASRFILDLLGLK